MVRRRVIVAVPVDVRVELAARWRASAGRWCGALGQPVECGRADDLAAGRPVEVSGWEVARWFEAPRSFGPNDRLRLEADGSLVVLPQPRRKRRW